MTTNQDLYIIAGDSWGCGEWQGMDISHRGLWQYMTDAGYCTVNISKPGGSNIDTLERLLLFFSDGVRIPLQLKVKKVLIFQTEWHRDIDQTFMTQWKTDSHIKIICQWQYRLSELAVEHDIEIGLIGGHSDTIYLDDFSKEYPNLVILCQSLINLCINGNHRIDTPCFGISSQYLENLAHESLSSDQLKSLLNLMQQNIDRHRVYDEHPDFFQYSHANRRSHKILYDHIRKQGFI